MNSSGSWQLVRDAGFYLRATWQKYSSGIRTGWQGGRINLSGSKAGSRGQGVRILSGSRQQGRIILSGSSAAGGRINISGSSAGSRGQGGRIILSGSRQQGAGWHEVESQLSAWAGIKVKARSPIHKQ